MNPNSQSYGTNRKNQIDPYETLGVSPNSSKEEIKKAYYSAIAKYHPDKVDHLGEDIKTLAREKTNALNEAYQLLK